MREPGRILIVKLSSIGDVVQSLPVAAALRRRFPSGYLAWAVEPAAADVLIGNPHLNDVLVIGGAGVGRARRAYSAEVADASSATKAGCPPPTWAGSGDSARPLPPLSSPAALRRALRPFRFGVSLDLQGLLKSAAVAYLSGARDRIGYRSLREATFFLNNRRIVPDRRDVHAVESYLDFAEALGARREPVEFTIVISGGDRAVVDALLGVAGAPFDCAQGKRSCPTHAALIPGARWASKLWPTGRFAAVADALAEEFGLTSVVVGGPGDAGLAREIAAASRAPVVDLTGRTTLKQAAEVFRRCRVTIGNDTGPLYLSAAMGTPTVAVFGPTDSRRLGPYGDGHAKVVAEIPCAPCRNRRCQPLKCMAAIEPERVVAAARALLQARPVEA
jgi:heptosyltransferase-1